MDKVRRERRAHPQRGAPAHPSCGRLTYPLAAVGKTGTTRVRTAGNARNVRTRVVAHGVSRRWCAEQATVPDCCGGSVLRSGLLA